MFNINNDNKKIDKIVYIENNKNINNNEYEKLNNNNNNLINEICNQLLINEMKWWRYEIPKEQISQLLQLGYNVENLLFFGELTFTIKGIKPMTLISEFSDEYLNQSFLDKVIKKSILDKLPFIGYLIINKLETSNCCFNNCLIIYNKNHINHYNNLINLIKTQNNHYQQQQQTNQKIMINLKENQLSELLDYPFSLPENIVDIQENQDNGDYKMMDIGYQSENKIILSYFCSFNQLKSNRNIIDSHFNNYNKIFKETFLNSQLKLKVSFT